MMIQAPIRGIALGEYLLKEPYPKLLLWRQTILDLNIWCINCYGTQEQCGCCPGCGNDKRVGAHGRACTLANLRLNPFLDIPEDGPLAGVPLTKAGRKLLTGPPPWSHRKD